MAGEIKKEIQLEIGHVLFIDIVGYSKLSLQEQGAAIDQLNRFARAAAEFQRGEEVHRLTKLPTGDGMALVFFTTPEAPVRCAIEISRAAKSHSKLHLRMGIHCGPVSNVIDVKEQTNVAGAGINIAQRVMDCGDADQILLSKRVADDLAESEEWRSRLHDLGSCQVKHGSRIPIVNLYGDDFGRPDLPTKLREQRRGVAKNRSLIAAAVLCVVALLAVVVWRQRTTRIQIAAEKSIAVLPFTDISQTKDQEYLCDGISEQILDALANIEGLKVVARTSSFSFKGRNVDAPEVMRALNVDNVLEGSVRRSGNRLRITTQLITRDGFNRWSQTSEHELQDIFAVQDQITRSVVDALRIKLALPLRQRPTLNTEAYQLYLQGRFAWNKRSPAAVQKSIDYFNQAIAKDPNFALPYSGLADSYSVLGTYLDVLPPKEAMPKAKAAGLKALELDPSSSEAHTSLAFVQCNYEWDWAGAEREFKRAIELGPSNANAHHWYSHFLVARGRIDESLAESQRALELDQLNPVMTTHLGWHYFHAHQNDLAIKQHKKTIETDPNYGVAHWYLGQAYAQQRMYDQAVAELGKAESLLKGHPGVEADIGYVNAVSGKADLAREVIDALKQRSTNDYIASYYPAVVYAGLGWKDQAFQSLGEAFDQRSDSLIYLQLDPRLAPLRSDPRFVDLTKRVGLTSKK